MTTSNLLTTSVTGVGQTIHSGSGLRTYQATVIGTGAVGATVKVQGSNDGSHWLDLGTITLAGTTSASDGFVSQAPWAYVRGNVTSISGTGASVTLMMGE